MRSYKQRKVVGWTAKTTDAQFEIKISTTFVDVCTYDTSQKHFYLSVSKTYKTRVKNAVGAACVNFCWKHFFLSSCSNEYFLVALQISVAWQALLHLRSSSRYLALIATEMCGNIFAASPHTKYHKNKYIEHFWRFKHVHKRTETWQSQRAHLRPGTHYSHVMWAHMMFRVQLECERRLNSMVQIHTSVTVLTSRDLAWSSGRLTCQHASQISAVAHISWDVTYVSSALQTLPGVSRNGGDAYWKIAPMDLLMWHQVARL
jgi:hypothetical protein